VTPASKFARLVAYAYTLSVYDFGSKDGAARAHIETIDGLKTVAVPGTNDFACWLADLDILTANTPLGTIHQGFHLAAQTIAGQVIGETPDVLTGHSEGADLALHFAGDCCLAGHPPKLVWAFEPAHLCIDDTLAGIFKHYGVDVKITRHGGDIVPIVPRKIHPWRHPLVSPVIPFGVPTPVIGGLEDHYLDDRFIADLDGSGL
jgi:hypothetical protein